MNNKAMIVAFLMVIGVVIFFSSFITIKPKTIDKYKVKKSISKYSLKHLINLIEKSKVFKLIINHENKSNIKLKKQLKTIGSSLTLERLFIYKTMLFVLIIVITLGVRGNFSTMIESTMLNPFSIYDASDFTIEHNISETITRTVGEDYRTYLKSNNPEGLFERIRNIITENNLYLSDKEIERMVDIYRNTYSETTLGPRDIIIIVLGTGVFVGLIDSVIAALYKIRRADMLKEFEKLEIMTILLMNREDLNTKDIITEMEEQSIYLKPYFSKCLRAYPVNPTNAINGLISDVDEPDFRNFMIIIRSCLDLSKNNNREMLKIQRELRLVLEETALNAKYRRKSTYLTIAQFPLLLLMSLDLILPIISKVDFNF